MASSNNTSPEGGSPPHQNRIRQVSVRVWNERNISLFGVQCVWASVTPVFRGLVVHDAEDEALSWLPNLSEASVDYRNVARFIS